MSFLLNLLFFPLDLLYLTVDAWRITLDMHTYRSLRSERDQPCVFCKRQDVGYAPRRLPPGLRKYRNQWLSCMLQPCIQGGIHSQTRPKRTCGQDGGFVKYPRQICWLAYALTAGWIVLTVWVLRFF